MSEPTEPTTEAGNRLAATGHPLADILAIEDEVLAAAAARVEALTALLREARERVRHTFGCRWNKRTGMCSCGVPDLLIRIDAALSALTPEASDHE